MKKYENQNTYLPKHCQKQRQCHLLCLCENGNMSTVQDYLQERSETNLRKDLNGLNDVYREIADEIGIENTLVIYKLFHGTQVLFPNKLFSKEYTYKAIVEEYNGKNISQLAQKYNYSERTIWRILKTSKY